MEYPTSSASDVIMLPAGGQIIVTIVHVSPGAPSSGVAKEILSALLEDVQEYVLPILCGFFDDPDEEDTADEGSDEQSDDECTDITCEKRYGVKDDDVTIQVIVRFPEIDISMHSLAQLLDCVVSVDSRAYLRSWMCLDPQDYEIHRAINEGSADAEEVQTFEETGIGADESTIVVLPTTSITPDTPMENHPWN